MQPGWSVQLLESPEVKLQSASLFGGESHVSVSPVSNTSFQFHGSALCCCAKRVLSRLFVEHGFAPTENHIEREKIPSAKTELDAPVTLIWSSSPCPQRNGHIADIL